MNTPNSPGPELSGETALPPEPSYSFLRPARGAGEIGWLADYRVLRALGSGGMGVVFEAEDTILRRRVALKVLRPELATDPAHRERFLREARAAAGIASDHVVTIYHVGESAMLPYLVMQFLVGETLQDRLNRQPLDIPTALLIARHAAAGLAAAHTRGLIHRDIKPANVWLETDGPGGAFKRARLLDFGLARMATGETSLTATGFIVGTPNYMAPEQAAGVEIDHRADLFSLGSVMYTMLTSELPFPGDSAMVVMMALASRTPPWVSDKNPAVPVAVSNLVARLLTKDPENRPQTADEVIAVLDSVLARLTTPVPGVPPAPTVPVPKPAPAGETLGPTSIDTRPVAPTPVPAPARESRLGRPAILGAGIVLLLAVFAGIAYRATRPGTPDVPTPGPEPIRVGVLHSRTGTMAVSELPVIDATLLAIDELNAAGGVLGRPVEAIVVDGKSDADVFAAEAERLVTAEKVSVIFGCWTSASRKAVIPVVEQRKNLLFYPVEYEGLEDSPRVVYLGPAPNQQLIPAVEYLVRDLGKKRLLLIGSDYVFPHVAHQIIRDRVKEFPGGEVVGELFLPLGATDARQVSIKITQTKPDAIVNTINGGTNLHFFRLLRATGVKPAELPVMSVSIGETEILGLDPPAMAGDFLAASYFHRPDRPASAEFIGKIRARHGQGRVTSDAMAAAYNGVHLWAKAATAARSADPTVVVGAVGDREFPGPSGLVRIDPDNHHTWQPWRIGRLPADGTVEVVRESAGLVRPEPFPPTRTRPEWSQLLTQLQLKWDGRWQPPAKP